VRRSVYNNVRAVAAIGPGTQRVNGTVNGATIDRYGNDAYARSVAFVILSGTITDGTHAVTIEDSDNGTDWSTAAAGDVQGSLPSFASTDDNKLFEVGYVGPRRYVRCNLVTSGATTGGFLDAVALLGVQPVKRP
jgi:hypothetical protein